MRIVIDLQGAQSESRYRGVGRYALALKAFSIDDLFAELDRLCADPVRNGDCSNYYPFVRSVARAVGAREASLFLRRQAAGPYRLEVSLHRLEWSHGQHSGEPGEVAADPGQGAVPATRGPHSYEPGEGVTGWVLKHNRPVRIGDLRDEGELRALDPEDPPRWLHKGYTEAELEDLGYAYRPPPWPPAARCWGCCV